MLNTSKHTLKLLASLVWYSGIIVLFIKSSILLSHAEKLNPNQYWIGLAVLSGLIIGFIKAKYLFRKLCLKNLNRIYALESPKLWQFYRIPFFIFLITMIILGSSISHLAQNHYAALIGMSVIEISIATALLGSSHCFWKDH
jgi:hypothetical protein